MKDNIIQKAHLLEETNWEGNKMVLYQDISQATLSKRMFKPHIEQLTKQGIR